MKLKEIVRKYEALVPKELAEDWDNIGLLLGDEEMEVSRVLTALEASDDVIDYAVENRFDLIFCHHPLIFSPINRINNNLLGNKIIKLIKNDVAVYVSHTNIDNYEFGLNHHFLTMLGAKNIYRDESGVFKADFPCEDGRHLVSEIKEVVGVNYLNFVGDIDSKVEKIALVTGSGSSFINDELIASVDVFLTGDIKYHTAMDVMEKGGRLVDITHYGSEFIVGTLFLHILKKICSDLEIDVYKNFNNPLRTL